MVTLYILQICVIRNGCLRGSLYKASASDAVGPGFKPLLGPFFLLLFFFYLFFIIIYLIYLRGSVMDFWHLFEQPKYMIYICVAGKARQIMAYFCNKLLPTILVR